MEIRLLEERDRDEWLRLRCALWPDGESTHSEEIDRFYSGTLAEPEAVLVADDGNQLQGLAELSIRAYAEGCNTDRVAYLEGWYVEPTARNRGVGRALVNAAEEWAGRQGCSEFASDAKLENEDSAMAHVACGFSEVGRLRCFRKAL